MFSFLLPVKGDAFETEDTEMSCYPVTEQDCTKRGTSHSEKRLGPWQGAAGGFGTLAWKSPRP